MTFRMWRCFDNMSEYLRAKCSFAQLNLIFIGTRRQKKNLKYKVSISSLILICSCCGISAVTKVFAFDEESLFEIIPCD